MLEKSGGNMGEMPILIMVRHSKSGSEILIKLIPCDNKKQCFYERTIEPLDSTDAYV